MKIGLWNLEPKIFNTALMQVSFYHKNRGDQVEFYSPLFIYDRVYVFSLFDYTPKPICLDSRFICGGTGFDLQKRLSNDIEDSDLDYSVYPNCFTSFLWFSRGCNLKHSYCCVPQKEGCLRVVSPKNLNPHGKYVDVMDDSPFASPKWFDMVEYLQKVGMPVNFNTLDIRNLDDLKCKALQRLRFYKQIHVSWDDPNEDLSDKFELLLNYFKPSKIACYVLIGCGSKKEDDLMRVEYCRRIGVDPFVMPFNRKDRYQRDFARYVNFKAIFKSVAWADYK